MKVAEEGMTRNCSIGDIDVIIRKFAFSNRVVDNWNLLSACCVNTK